jgi:hypothetical protein
LNRFIDDLRTDKMIRRPITIALVILSLVILVGVVFQQYSALQSIANVAQIIEGVAALALLVVAMEIRESMKARHLEGMRYIKSLISSEEAAEKRKWAYQELRKASWPLSPDDEREALAICRDFDHIGFLCRHGLIPVDLVAETYNHNIVDMWNRLQRFVTEWRDQRGDEDYFWEFEWLAGRAEATRTKPKGKERTSQ